MASVNKVILVGHLGRDPEVRYTPEGTCTAQIALATSEQWKDKKGEKQDRTEWHRVVFWERQAEVVGEYLKKGSQVYIEGSLRTRKWTDKDGNDRYTTEIQARSMQMLSKKPDGDSSAQDYAAQSRGRETLTKPYDGEPNRASHAQGNEMPWDDGDIPF